VPRGDDAQARVSVVIPVWDEYAGASLLEAAASVRGQQVPVRLIVVDNASSVPLPPLDDVELVRLEQRHSTGAARNAALPLLETPYVMFLDADDRLLDGALAALVAGLDADPRRATHTLSIIDWATGATHRTPRRLARALSRVPPLFTVANAIWSLLPTQGCTIMRLPHVRSSGGYGDSSTGEDWVLATSLSFRGRQSFEDRPGLLYRQSIDSPGVRPLDRGTLLENARRVRERIDTDPETPAYLKPLSPAIRLAQWIAASIAHPLYRRGRSAIRRL
jgi:glycosyltransferase involved in cell wall biosynthesis